ncbi:hypothetical protein HDU93_005919, partial [Gonapodya sp. JEL0774]
EVMVNDRIAIRFAETIVYIGKLKPSTRSRNDIQESSDRIEKELRQLLSCRTMTNERDVPKLLIRLAELWDHIIPPEPAKYHAFGCTYRDPDRSRYSGIAGVMDDLPGLVYCLESERHAAEEIKEAVDYLTGPRVDSGG